MDKFPNNTNNSIPGELLNHNAHFTKFKYLSIDKHYLNNTTSENIYVGGYLFSIAKLKTTITYKDNKHYFRWNRNAFTKAILEYPSDMERQ